MYTIDKIYTFEHIIKKSRFIGHLAPVTSLEEAQNFLKSIRKTHYDATHNCYSYIIGKNGEYYKNSDDGEPSQTAGVVIYDVLKKQELTNVICIITRYFGGIKLGAGGLVRAYGSTTGEVIKLANKIAIVSYSKLSITFDYPHADEIFNFLNSYECSEKLFSEKISCTYIIPEDDCPLLREKLVNMTKNNISIKIDRI